ncbi:MAG TPA: hypothetical protein VGO17_03045 [Aurantimonas sp.]|jgi:hypothetical protein|nr:hypothetical protein [Aurantimonas sp.]
MTLRHLRFVARLANNMARDEYYLIKARSDMITDAQLIWIVVEAGLVGGAFI